MTDQDLVAKKLALVETYLQQLTLAQPDLLRMDGTPITCRPSGYARVSLIMSDSSARAEAHRRSWSGGVVERLGMVWTLVIRRKVLNEYSRTRPRLAFGGRRTNQYSPEAARRFQRYPMAMYLAGLAA